MSNKQPLTPNLRPDPEVDPRFADDVWDDTDHEQVFRNAQALLDADDDDIKSFSLVISYDHGTSVMQGISPSVPGDEQVVESVHLSACHLRNLAVTTEAELSEVVPLVEEWAAQMEVE